MNPYDQMAEILSGKRPFPIEEEPIITNPYDHLNADTSTNPPILEEDYEGKYAIFAGLKIPDSTPMNKAALGVPGSGKTNILYQYLKSTLEKVKPGSHRRVIITDVKRDVLPIASYYAKKNRVPLIHYDMSDRRGWDWNMLADTGGDLDLINEISSTMIQPSKEPIFSQGAIILSNGMMLAAYREKGDKATIADIYKLNRLTYKEYVEAMSRTPDGKIYAARVLETDADKFSASIMMTTFIENEALRKAATHSLECPDNRRFTIKNDIINKECIVVVTCDTTVEHSAFPMIRAFLSSVINQVRAKPDLQFSSYPDDRTDIIIDEVHALGKIAALDKALSTGRSKGLSVTLAFHDIAQMRKVYDDASLKNITNCLDYIAIFRCTDPETSEWFVRRGGIERVENKSHGKSSGASGSGFSENTSIADRNRFVTSDIIYLPKADRRKGSVNILFHPYGFPFKRTLSPQLSNALQPQYDKDCPIFLPKGAATSTIRRIKPQVTPSSMEEVEKWVRAATSSLDLAMRLQAVSLLNEMCEGALEDLKIRLGIKK
jgi:Type IV secretion-system coupling protein DNA-binding domain